MLRSCILLQRLSLLAISGDVALTKVLAQPQGVGEFEFTRTRWASLVNDERAIAFAYDGLKVKCWEYAEGQIIEAPCDLVPPFKDRVMKTTDNIDAVTRFLNNTCRACIKGTFDSLPSGIKKWLRNRCADFDTAKVNIEAALETLAMDVTAGITTLPQAFSKGLQSLATGIFSVISSIFKPAMTDVQIVPYSGEVAMVQLWLAVVRYGCSIDPLTWSLVGAIAR